MRMHSLALAARTHAHAHMHMHMHMHVHMHSLSGQVGGWEGREGKGGESAEEHSNPHHPLLRIGAEVALRWAVVFRSQEVGV